MAFNSCEAGAGIMVITSTYSMHEIDLCARAAAAIIEVSSADIQDQFREICAETLLANFCKAFDDATGRGTAVKAVLLCNPSNPQGRCYSRHTLTEIAKFCGSRGLHVFADEIYAMSAFKSVEDDYKLDDFTSVLSLPRDEKKGVFPENIHSMYGASKDFGMGGMRLGFLITRNEQFWRTCRRTTVFTWITPFSASFFTAFISNEIGIEKYLMTYRSRLRQRYIQTTQLLKVKGIPHDPANSGLFVWLDLSKWLCYFTGTDQSKSGDGDTESREEKLYRYILSRGVVLNLGKESKSSSPGRFRFVYTGPENWAQLAIKRMSEALSDLEKKGDKGR